MNNMTRLFFRSLELPGLIALVSTTLFIGLMFMADGFLLLLVSSYTGGLAAIAATAVISLLGALLVGSSFHRHSRIALETIHGGVYPRDEFIHLSTLFVSLLLITIPGFFTSLIGGILYLPALRKLLGIMLHRKFEDSFREVYSFSRIQEE